MKKLPRATQQQKKDGWTFSYRLLEEISKRSRNGFHVGLEEAEVVLKLLLNMGYVE